MNPLMIASSNGYISIIDKLNQMGAMVNDCSSDLIPPIQYAAIKGNTYIIKYLIGLGANVNCKCNSLLYSLMVLLLFFKHPNQKKPKQ